MQYAITRKDGGVSVMVLLPIGVVVDGEEMRDIKIKDGILTTGEHSWPLPGDVSGLTPDSIPGVVLVFPSPEDEIKKWDQSLQGSVLDVQAISAVPVDRSYRDAWTHDGKGIVHDMAKARAIHRDKLRSVRSGKLAALDIEYQRADESGDTARKQAIAARKMVLRDITKDPRIDAAQDVEALRAVTLD